MSNQKSKSRKITLAVVVGIEPGETIWDSELKGFCARRQTGSTISYCLKARVNGRIRWFAIGHHGAWTPDAARKRAREILVDPAGAEKAIVRASLTFEVVAAEFFKNHGPKLKPRTLEGYEQLEKKYLRPAFGTYPIADISRALVSRAHAKWSETPRTANHALSVLSKVMSWAEDQGYRPEMTNPCRRIQKYKENRRERFLTPDELTRLGKALAKLEADKSLDVFTASAIRLLAFTGARLSEILTLRWSDVDLTRQLLLLPDSKTGRKVIVLNQASLAILSKLPQFEGNPYVIPGRKDGQHLINLQKPWRRVRKLARLDDIRLHDLRHTFASFAVASGGSLPVLGRQLGHSQPQTTQRYAHLADYPVRQLTEATGAVIERAMAGVPE